MIRGPLSFLAVKGRTFAVWGRALAEDFGLVVVGIRAALLDFIYELCEVSLVVLLMFYLGTAGFFSSICDDLLAANGL